MAYRGENGAVIDRPGSERWAAFIAAPPLVPAAPIDRAANASARRGLPRCPEIDCVRHLLPPAILALAELRAAEVGVGADRVLITAGHITEEAYLAALSASLGIPFESLDGIPRAAFPFGDDALIEAELQGVLQLNLGGELHLVIAPRELSIRRLLSAVRPDSDLLRRIRLTSTERLRRFVAGHGAREIEHRAVEALRETRPELSAGARNQRSFGLMILAAHMVLIGLIFLAAPGAAWLAVEVALGCVFLAWTGLRMIGLLSAPFVGRRPRAFADERLPIYTVAVALYQEATAVSGLVAALRQLNYPPEKLDIKIVLEPDDHETRAMVESLQLGAPFEVIIAPEVGPRTKPKALNAMLPFARGTFVAVYDAEDRPEPDQLRLALEAFVADNGTLACVQARLTIDNTVDSWLARVFTAEYAGLFDVFLPGLAALRLPLPLGGSSNHFRTAVLRRIGAWDPYNVTEDADLGMRLARFGYRTSVIPSSTYEEAPARFKPWLRQRTRWFKGWLQTWLVHMRSPRQLMRELGVPGFIVFQLLVGGTVVAALIHTLFAVKLMWEIWTETLGLFTLYVVTLVLGYVVSGVLGLIGLARRRLLGCAWALLLMPIYWVLLSLAAWRALLKLLHDPYHWEKTEHGLANTSRLADRESDAINRPGRRR